VSEPLPNISKPLLERFSVLAFFLSVIVTLPGTCFAQSSPQKEQLIKTLKTVHSLLKSNDFSGASKHLVLPANFKPEMLDGILSRREISLNGINRLEKEAKFGKASEVFAAERASRFATRAGVDLEQCYGFNYEADSVAAEVIAVWDGTNFKLIRFDDIGKLEPLTEQAPAKMVAADLPALRLSAESEPNNVAARATYAMALFKIGNFPEAWSQLIQARKLDPKHAGITKGLSVVFNEFEKRGIFTVGVPSETIESLLGTPKQKIDLGRGRQRWVYAFLGVDFAADRVHEVIDLRGATNELFSPTEIVSLDLDGRGWRCGFRKKKRGNSAAYYFVPGESVAEWKEEFVIERILNGADVGSIDTIVQKMATQLSAIDPDTKHKILSTEVDSAIVAIMLPAKGDSPPQHKLVRLMKGPVDLHRLAYTRKGDAPSQQTQAKWFAIFKSAKLDAAK